MKYIFDFDDVIFHTTPKFKDHLRGVFEQAGISRVEFEEYLEKEQWKHFSVKKLLHHFLPEQDLYGTVMQKNSDFVNQDILKIIKKIGKENSFIVTYGDEEFQRQKIQEAGINEFFLDIVVTPGSKKEAVEKIASVYNNEIVFFIDDKEHNFADLDLKKYPNLKTILYTGQNLDNII